MRSIASVIPLSLRRPAVGASVVASCGFHALVLAAMAWNWPSWSDVDQHVRLPGRAEVLRVEAAWLPPEPPAARIESSGDPSVVVEPHQARIEKRRFVMAGTRVDLTDAETGREASRWVLGDVVLGDVPHRSTVADQQTVPNRSSDQHADPPRRAMVSERPAVSSVAHLPQTPGTEDTTPPSFIHNRPPRYPELARRRGWQGTVLLRLTVAASGQVLAVDVVRSSGHALLDAEAVNTVRRWRAEPARRGGRPVRTEEILPIRFSLNEE